MVEYLNNTPRLCREVISVHRKTVPNPPYYYIHRGNKELIADPKLDNKTILQIINNYYEALGYKVVKIA